MSSLYLRLWPDKRIHQTKLKDLLRKKLGEFGQRDHSLPEERQWIEKDLIKIKGFVETLLESPHKGLVIFSCTAEEVWEVFFLAQPVRDQLVLDSSAYIRPLTSILDQYRRACTLLVDRTRARIFEVFMGEIEEQTEIFTNVPSKVREGGWYGLSERKIERHIKHHLHDHLKQVSDQTFIHFGKKGFDWLFLGGQIEVLPQMENTLHSYLRKKLKRTFRMDLSSDTKAVLDKTLELEGEVKKKEDRVLISRLTDSLKPEGLGVTGIHETLSSLYEGSVHTLLVEEGFSQEGAYCSKCRFMGLSAGLCPICGKEMSFVPDIVGEAVAAAIDQNCEVFHITPGCGLREVGSIGALLRYKGASII
jgi:peptide chain release factor subunit 1